ncbi:MAG: hypothetical protein HS116_02390 [Planctomycetes bacterium]|nr:hypothetical protein [Planctomycetota bacterium]
MRLALVAAIWAILVGGVHGYLHLRTDARPAPDARFERAEAAGRYELEVTASFSWRAEDAAPDPFALKAATSAAPPLAFKLDGQDLPVWSQPLEAGQPVRTAPLPGVKTGIVEFLVRAAPPPDEAQRRHALRLRLLRDGEALDERTFWTEPGLGLTATFAVRVDPAQGPWRAEGHEHDGH